MKNKIKVHDGIVGSLILASLLLAHYINYQWIVLAGAIALLMIVSAFSGFCPVYFVLNKAMPSDDKSKCC
jgi:hypothetical protein